MSFGKIFPGQRLPVVTTRELDVSRYGRSEEQRNAWQEKQLLELMAALRRMIDDEIKREEQPFFVPVRRIKGALDELQRASDASGRSALRLFEDAVAAMRLLTQSQPRERPTHTHADLEPHACAVCGYRHKHCCEDGEFCEGAARIV